MIKFNHKGIKTLLTGAKIENLVGVDLSGDILKVVYVRSSTNKKEIVRLISKKISGLSDIDIAKAVNLSVLELKLKSPVIIDIIPSNIVITKNIEVPSVNPKEIKEIINLQAGRHTPYSREEILVDRIDIGVSKNSYTMVLLVIVARHIVKRQFDIFESAGFKPERVLFAPEGLALASSSIFGLKTDDAPLSIVHVDEGYTDFSVVHRGKIIFVRSIPIGAHLLALEKEKYEIRFIEETRRSLEAYNSENVAKNISMLILTGAIGEVGGLQTLLSDNLRLPVTLMSDPKNISISEEALVEASAAKRVSFLNVIAPLLSLDQAKVNLVPEEMVIRKSLEQRGKELLTSAICILAVLTLVCLILISKMYFKNAYINELNIRYQTLNQEAQKLEKDFTRVSLVKKYLATRGYSVRVLGEIYELMPINMEASDIRFDEQQGKVNVKGTAESMSIVFTFMSAMEQSKLFKDVKAAYTTKRKEGLNDLADFEITALLGKGADQ